MTKLENVDWVIGAFMMISKKAYEAVCGMDEKYFCIVRIWIFVRRYMIKAIK